MKACVEGNNYESLTRPQRHGKRWQGDRKGKKREGKKGEGGDRERSQRLCLVTTQCSGGLEVDSLTVHLCDL